MKFDVAVIGGGPAGLSASIFSSRAGLKTICFEMLAVGGQANFSHNIENYPGFKSVSGFDLGQDMFKQSKECGVEFVFEAVVKISKNKNSFLIKTKTQEFHAEKIIIASGTIPRKLGLNEDRFIGKGISYCASCDGNFFKGKPVAIVGGGDSAFVYAEYLSRLAKEVYILNRSEKFRANAFRVKQAEKIKNVKILTNVEVIELLGEDLLKGVKLNNGHVLEVDGLFVAIGHIPKIDYLDFTIDKDHDGYIIVDKEMKTNVKNVFACGDIINKHFRQVITACADGAIAGNSCVGVTNEK